MASRNLGSLTVDLVLKLGGFVQGADRAAREAQQLERKLKTSFTNIGRGLSTLAGAIGAGFGFAEIVRSTAEAERSFALLENAVRNNAGAAGQTADQLAETAKALQSVTTFSDEAVQSAQTLLLSFRSINGESFDQATEAALNLATALGKDVSSAALLVGKALEDPTKGMTQLARAGVVFNAEQKKVIENLVKTGQAAEAQAIILQELENRFGNAARAARDNFAGALEGLRNQFNELFELKGGLDGATDAVNDLTKALQDPGAKQGLDTLISGFIRLGAVATTAALEGVGAITDLVQTLPNATAGLLNLDIDIPVGLDAKELEAEIKRVEARLDRVRKTGAPLIPIAVDNAEIEALEKHLAKLKATRIEGPTVVPQVAGDGFGTLTEDEIAQLEKLEETAQRVTRTWASEMTKLAALQQRSRGTIFEIDDSEFKALAAEIDKEFAKPRTLKVSKVDFDPAPFLQEIVVSVNRATVSATEQLYREMNAATQTAQEATLAQWAEFQTQLAELVKAGVITAEQAAAREIEIRVRLDVDGFKKQVEEFSDEVDKIREEAGRREQTIDVRVQTGNVSEIGGRRELIEAHQREAAELQKVVDQYKAVAQAARDAGRPNLELEKEIRQIEAAIEDLKTTTDEFGKILADAFETGVSDALSDVAKGVKSLGEAAEDFLQSITDALLDWAAQQIASQMRDIIFGSLPQFGAGALGGLFKSAGGGTALEEISVTTARLPEIGGEAGAAAAATALTTAGTTLTTGATTLTTGATTFATGAASFATAAATLVTAGSSLTAAGASLTAAAAALTASAATDAAGGLSEIIITTARLAEGGKVFGPGGVDRVPAMLTAGEFVVKAQAVQKPGVQQLLERINDGGGIFRHFAEGGSVERASQPAAILVPSRDTLREHTDSSNTVFHSLREYIRHSDRATTALRESSSSTASTAFVTSSQATERLEVQRLLTELRHYDRTLIERIAPFLITLPAATSSRWIDRPPLFRAEGGPVIGPGTATSDSIPAMLSAGEFIVKAEAVKQPGVLRVLERINDGASFRGFAEGGYTGPPRFTIPRFANGGLVRPEAQLAGSTLTVTVPVSEDTGRRQTIVQQSITVNAPSGNISKPTEMQITAATARGVRVADRHNN